MLVSLMVEQKVSRISIFECRQVEQTANDV